MEEKKIGAIPHVNVVTPFGPKECGVLVTEERTIFALLREPRTAAGWVVAGAIGSAVANAVAKERCVDLGNTPPETLACYSGNICVPHNSLENLKFKKGVAANYMFMTYRNEKGKKKKLEVALVPTPEYIKRMKVSGVKPKEAKKQYAKSVEEVYRNALPLSVSTGTEWLK
jgi:hypothetical protein